MVEQVEELRAELQAHPFADGQPEVLDNGEIGIHKPGAINWRARSRPELSDGCRICVCADKGARIEPILKRVHFGRCDTARICCDLPALVRIANLEGPIKPASTIPEERHTRCVVAVDYEERKARHNPFDDIR